MWSPSMFQCAGVAALVGGVLALAVTPFIVIVKYSTGWSIIPKPAWEANLRAMVEPLVTFATPVQLWMFYGAIYTVAMLLMGWGVLALRARTARAGRSWHTMLWVMMAGLGLVVVGDALHSLTWHLGGETLPRPGLHPVASVGMSMAYLGLPIVFVASFGMGVMGLMHGIVPKPLAALFLAVGPGGALLTGTQLPAMPSGSLSVFAVAMAVLGLLLLTTPSAMSRADRRSVS